MIFKFNSNQYFIILFYLFLDVIQTHSCQISELRSVVDFVGTQKINQTDDIVKLEKFSNSIEFKVRKLLDDYTLRNERETNKKIEAVLLER